MSLRDARKRVRSLKLQLFCTLVGLEASGMSSVLGERCRGGPRCCLPRLPGRCELLSRMRSLMPILLLQGRAGWAASEVSGRREGRGWGQGGEWIPAAGTPGAHRSGGEDGGGRAELTESPRHAMGTSSCASQARSRRHRMPVQEWLWGYFFKQLSPPPRAEKGGETQTGRAGRHRYGGRDDTQQSRRQSNRPWPRREQPCSCPIPAGMGRPGTPSQAPSSSSFSRLHHSTQALLQ